MDPNQPKETEVRQRCTCPLDGQDVETTFARDASGRWLRATRCSAFFVPERVDCTQVCVPLRNRGAKSEGDSDVGHPAA